MIRALMLLGVCAFGAATFAQAPAPYGLSPDGARQLQELRLRRSQEALLAAPGLESRLGKRVAGLEDRELNQVVLRDLSLADANAKATARLRMNELSRIAATPEGSAALGAAGWDSQSLRQLSLRPQAPTMEMTELQMRFGVDAQGRLLLRPGTLIIHQESPAPDTLRPGELPPGHQGLTPIWRRGLLFAVAVGTVNDNVAQSFCSGTIVDKHWVVTAGHCLRWGGQRLDATRLAVFLPFQAGGIDVRNVAGGFDHKLRKVRVIDAKWVGDVAGQPLPLTDADMGKMVLDGSDVALLKLDESDMNGLPLGIPDVQIVPASAVKAPISLVGYGLSTATAPDGLSMSVGVRDSLPYGVDTGKQVYFFGSAGNGNAGLCGGDSGGGLFVGRLDGSPGTARHLFGVISGLVGADSNTLSHCLSQQQVFTPLMSERNRDFICNTAVHACPQPL